MTDSILSRSPAMVLGVVAFALAVIVAVARSSANPAHHRRRVMLFLGLYVVAVLATTLLPTGSLRDIAASSAEMLALFTMVVAGGVLIFDVVLPALRFQLPTIVAELAMGVCYVLALLSAMRRLGVEPTGIVTTSAVVTAVLALSLQATLGNILGGVALQLDKSIRVGDWVQLENGRQGLVREIRWRHTVIETRDWDTIVVPNAQLLSGTFTLLGRRTGEPETKRRETVQFTVDFRWAPNEVVGLVESALRDAEFTGIAREPQPRCVCLDLAAEQRPSMALYAVRFWLTDLAIDETVRSHLRTRIFAALKRGEIPLAVPATHVWVENDSPERRARKHETEFERRRGAIRGVPFFAPLKQDEIEALADRLRYAPFVAGEEMTHEGDRADWLYLVLSGSVEVAVESTGGRQKVAMLEGPTVIGEMGLLTGAPRTASVHARSQVESYRLDKEAFRKTLEARPALAEELSAIVAVREVSLSSRRDGAGTGNVEDASGSERARLLETVRRFFGIDGSRK
ncbi:MAG: mechanosensitive ion channel family protein [Deltaproteobacteria bacterium]|nr:mechanosensitive ion channel family protein [Deltaproteobacteria bacterium]